MSAKMNINIFDLDHMRQRPMHSDRIKAIHRFARRARQSRQRPNGRYMGDAETLCAKFGVTCPAGSGHVEVYENPRLKTRLGQCVYANGTSWIEINSKVVGSDHERDTFLHELAHAIAGNNAGHGPAWKSVARSLGCDGQRCAADGVSEELGLRETQQPRRHVGTCNLCGYKMMKARFPKIGSVYKHKGCPGRINII